MSMPINFNIQHEPTTSFVGRDKQIQDVYDLLQREEVRLVTIHGEPGGGKTRFALKVAHKMAGMNDKHYDAVWFDYLVALTDPKQVIPTVAERLKITDTQPLVALKDYFGKNRVLLVLDNLEHLLTATQEDETEKLRDVINKLLKTSSSLKILVTSRETLNLHTCEKPYPLLPLKLPDEKNPPHPDTDAFNEYEALRLFIDRARDHMPAFEITEKNAQAVIEICRWLEGLPLAIELVASTIELRVPQAMLNYLKSGKYLGIRGKYGSDKDHHETLRAAFEWSYRLLSDDEKQLFKRMSVFWGGWTQESIVAVCYATNHKESWLRDQIKHRLKSLLNENPSDPCDDYNLEQHLQSLLSKILLRPSLGKTGERRFWRSGAILDFAIEKLKKEKIAGWAELCKRHAKYFLMLAQETEEQLMGTTRKKCLALLEDEHDNLLAVLRRVRESENVLTGLQLAGSLWRFWQASGRYKEGLEQLTNMLSLLGAEDIGDIARAKALHGMGVLKWEMSNYVEAQDNLEKSLKIYRELGDKRSIANVLNDLGNVAQKQKGYTRAGELHTESLKLRRELKDDRGIANSLNNLGFLAEEQGVYDKARQRYERSLEIKKRLKDEWGIANSANNLGRVAYKQGKYLDARQHLDESLEKYTALDAKKGKAYCLNNLADVDCAEGKYEPARLQYEASLKIKRDLGDQWGIVISLEGLAKLAWVEGKEKRAACLYGAAEAQRANISVPMSQSEQEQHAAIRDQAQLKWKDAWDKGRNMTMEQAIEYARKVEISVEKKPDASQLNVKGKRVFMVTTLEGEKVRVELTELEVLVLGYLKQGLTNSEIGDKLNFATNYINGILTRIYSNLGIVASERKARLKTRGKAKKFAEENGL